jgi:hypothetical protein
MIAHPDETLQQDQEQMLRSKTARHVTVSVAGVLENDYVKPSKTSASPFLMLGVKDTYQPEDHQEPQLVDLDAELLDQTPEYAP